MRAHMSKKLDMEAIKARWREPELDEKTMAGLGWRAFEDDVPALVERVEALEAALRDMLAHRLPLDDESTLKFRQANNRAKELLNG